MRTVVSIILAFSFVGCDKQEPVATSFAQPANEQAAVSNTPPAPGPIRGQVLDRQFEASRANLDGHILTLREGEDFIADIQVLIFLFRDVDELSENTIAVSAGEMHNNPHIHFGIKPEGENIVRSEVVTNDYDMVITFGEAERFGIPFSVSLDIKGDHNVTLAGQSFATFGDLNIVNGKPDLHYDSLDTLDYLAREFLRPQRPAIDSFHNFGGILTHYTEQPYPKEGFYGYAAAINDGSTPVLKVQMYKDEDGWAVHRVLGKNQIPQAHPIGKYVPAMERVRILDLAELATARKMEQDLNAEGIIHSVRSTNIRCSMIDQNEKEGSGTCLTSIGIQQEETIECTRRNYLLSRSSDQWTVEKKIGEDLRLDYKTGELVEKKNYGLGCG